MASDFAHFPENQLLLTTVSVESSVRQPPPGLPDLFLRRARALQLVSLNFQTPDENLTLYGGWFEDNGRCGYVLKPDFMTSGKTEFGPYLPQPSRWTRILTVRVISGYLIPNQLGDGSSDIVDFYVQVILLLPLFVTHVPRHCWLGVRNSILPVKVER